MRLSTQYRVVIGPPRAAARHARIQNWREEDCVFVSTFEQLRWGIDPITIRNITVLPGLPEDTTAAIDAELDVIKSVWPETIIIRNSPARPRSGKNTNRRA